MLLLPRFLRPGIVTSVIFAVLLQTLHRPVEDLRSPLGADPVAPPPRLAAAAPRSCPDLPRVTVGPLPISQRAGPVPGRTAWGGPRPSPTHLDPPRAARSPEAPPRHRGDPTSTRPLPASRRGGTAPCPPLLEAPRPATGRASPRLPTTLPAAAAATPCPPPREGGPRCRRTAPHRRPPLLAATGRPGTCPPRRPPSTPSRRPPRPPHPPPDPHPAGGRPPSRQADRDRPPSRPLRLEATTTATRVCPRGTAPSTGTCCFLFTHTDAALGRLTHLKKCVCILPATAQLARGPSPLRPMRGRRLWGGTSRHAQVSSFFL